jgi:hypothetical protein
MLADCSPHAVEYMHCCCHDGGHPRDGGHRGAECTAVTTPPWQSAPPTMLRHSQNLHWSFLAASVSSDSKSIASPVSCTMS